MLSNGTFGATGERNSLCVLRVLMLAAIQEKQSSLMPTARSANLQRDRETYNSVSPVLQCSQILPTPLAHCTASSQDIWNITVNSHKPKSIINYAKHSCKRPNPLQWGEEIRCGHADLRQLNIFESLQQGYCDMGGGGIKICFNLNRQCKYLQWIIHNHMSLHGFATGFQARTFSHCSVNGADFQKAAVLNCSELSEVIVLSLAYELILITNSIYNL